MKVKLHTYAYLGIMLLLHQSAIYSMGTNAIVNQSVSLIAQKASDPALYAGLMANMMTSLEFYVLGFDKAFAQNTPAVSASGGFIPAEPVGIQSQYDAMKNINKHLILMGMAYFLSTEKGRMTINNFNKTGRAVVTSVKDFIENYGG